MNTTNKSVMISLLAALNGCATQAQAPWTPMLDIKADTDTTAAMNDQKECQQLAFAGPRVGPMDTGSVVSAMYVNEFSYRQVLANCMRGRGHSVLNWE